MRRKRQKQDIAAPRGKRQDAWFRACTACAVLLGLWLLFHGISEAGAPKNPYVKDQAKTSTALRVHFEQTLARPAPAKRLFVEGYFMRAAVAAHEVLGAAAAGLDTGAGLERARTFADSLVARQLPHGYWPIGYATSWLADMGAALGVFVALEPHVDSTRVRAYVGSVTRFLRAIEGDGFLLSSGALGVGMPVTDSGVTKAWRSDVGWADDPYLVSTALVGIELQAWLFRHTGELVHRQRALQALAFTLRAIEKDGSLPSIARGEGVYTVAAYVEEGWMAADLLLGDPEVLARLRQALPPHVAWLLRTQKSDGAWESSVRGDFARTPGIVDFLIWYDQRCESREDVRAAVRKASRILTEPKRWQEHGLEESGDTIEVMRALLGRPLAALVAGRPVL